MPNIGSIYGLVRRGTILKYNGDGTVQVRLDERNSQQANSEFKVPMPSAWAGPSGEFMGGYPATGSPVTLKQSQGGQWFIENYIPSTSAFADPLNTSALKPGRAVMQVKGGTRIFVDPKIGIQAGSAESYIHADPSRSIFSHNYSMELAFTQAARHVEGIILRDIVENSNRNVLGPVLSSHIYNDSLTPIGMDPTAAPSISGAGGAIRNPPLVEARELVYEFADTFGFRSDSEEASRMAGIPQTVTANGRKDSRADVLSLGQQYPNQLMETIKGTVVDIHGNILDLNRNIIPIGRIDELSLRKNPDKVDALARIRAQERKSIAYHFEINTKKQGVIEDSGAEGISSIPDVDDVSDYSRRRSRFSIDIDKEGQFKINIPSSSETGNIGLLTRYENYPNLLSKKDGVTNPNAFIKNSERRDIFLDSFAGKPAITLSGSDETLDGYEAPIDRITEKPMLLGTAYHDITKVCYSFLPDAVKMNLYEENPLLDLEPYEKFVEENIIVSGKDANAGGRSGTFTSDGHISFNVGANTSDRQSMWSDFAGGIISQIGRDKRGVSWAANLDGDMLIQIGGAGIGNSFDSRFADLNDGSRIGALDIRIMAGDRPMTIFRLDNLGIRVATEGVLQLEGQQGIALNTHGDLALNGERVAFFTNTNLTRQVRRGPSRGTI